MASSKKIVALFCITLISMVAIGCSDDDNPVVTSTDPVDTAPPAVPANLSVAYDADLGAAVISWAANTVDTDLAGYVVSRDYYGDVDVLVGTPAMINDFQDDAPLMGTSTYNVFAVDTSGNQSAVASVELTRTGSKPGHEYER
jgi:hypothetical protein